MCQNTLSGCLRKSFCFGQHQFCQLLTRLRRGLWVERNTHTHNKIMRWEPMFVETKPLAYDPFHVIALVGTFGGFFADNQAQTCVSEMIALRLRYLHKMARTLFFKCENGRELFRFQQSVGFAKARVQLHSQAFATFGAASCQNSATTASFRAYQKAVGAFAFGNRRLVSAFHDENPKSI